MDHRNPASIIWPVPQRPLIAAPSSDEEAINELTERTANALEQYEPKIQKEESKQEKRKRHSTKKNKCSERIINR